ncbi:MAG: D-alanyl-D-alanine carboxypeptidase [Actinomycetia bacterium]|nr:D-alanyl-D-alanine carboxypeptidase [Actinomycetes bacterium]
MVVVVGAVASASPLWVEPPPVPVLSASDPPAVEAESWLLFDDRNEVVLAEHNADVRHPMASTTKMMTALLAVEVGDLSSPVQVSRTAAEVGGAGVNLVEGEVFLLRTLVRALLIRSGNDAAMAVAEHVGGTVEEFVGLMNQRAGELGLDDTSYANPHGLDHPEQYSTARDLLTLTREFLKHPELAEAVATKQIALRDAPTGDTRVYQNTNSLLADYEGVFGVKTGFTQDAGRVLVAGVERDDRRLISVVMRTADHFAATTALLDYGLHSVGSVPGMVATELRISREQVLVSRPSTTTTTTVAAAETEVVTEAETEGVETAGERVPEAVRVGKTPEGVLDLLGWMLRLFSSGAG